MFGDVTAETAREKVDQIVRIVGLVGSVKKNQIKKGQNEGKMMAKAVLEDLTGSVAVTVFASLLEKIHTWFATGRAVLVTGTVRSSSAPGMPDSAEGEGSAVPIEIIDQGRESRVEFGEQEPPVIVEAGERGSSVAIPGQILEEVLTHVHLDDASTRFHQLSRSQTIPAECTRAVGSTHPPRLISQSKGR